MLICIPTIGDTGKEDVVNEHFGSARYFTLYDSELDQIKVVENRNAHHDHGTCHPMNQLAKYKIDGIICSGIGRRAILTMQAEGIKVYHARDAQVAKVLENIKNGDLEEVDPSRACRGHGLQGGFVHGNQAGCGHGGKGGHGQGRDGGGSRD
ncbi:MAG: diguanylate cyclase [candidate division Zixibacteria bacterium HGW-Zixibacteria-1]|nr:MAG: diguanylate cyclase [candidate division Zixibacteria bacterium HGW-Zixibacteria-1]